MNEWMKAVMPESSLMHRKVEGAIMGGSRRNDFAGGDSERKFVNLALQPRGLAAVWVD